MQRAQVLQNARLAGEVKRYHAWPTLKEQTVGSHTWQLFRIHWTIWGPPSPALTTAIIWHDAGELVTGDPPFPIKAHNPMLKAEMDRLEGNAVLSMGGPNLSELALSNKDKRRLKLCDLLDMWEFGLVEHKMGNGFAIPIIDDVCRGIQKLAEGTSDAPKVQVYMEASLGRVPIS